MNPYFEPMENPIVKLILKLNLLRKYEKIRNKIPIPKPAPSDISRDL